MSYVFRLHKEGDNSLTGWGRSAKYSSNVIDQIRDPNGESAKREITSIPSPFARIDLVKTAFKKVADSSIDGDTINHKMVSDALDIGQIFFEYDKLQSKFEIITWDKKIHLEELLNSPYDEHQLLGKTYEIFLQQDGPIYNLDRMDRMYLLNYVNGPDRLNIIGATSPATFFFTSANDLSYISQDIRFANNDRPFDDEFMPLYKRDIAYQRFWYAIQRTQDFAKRFPEVNAYLEKNFKLNSQQNRMILQNLSPNDLQTMPDIAINGNAGNVVYIINDLTMKKKDASSGTSRNSDFLIDSNSTIADLKPLVLPVTKYTKPSFYMEGSWDPNTVVPYYDPNPFDKRILPDDGTRYPYLTISDFLSDTIIRMPYELNKENFFDCYFNGKNCSYLIPLTELFFTFFTTKDLMEKVMSDGKKMFEIQELTSGVSVILRIPITKGYIEYRRTYFEGTNTEETPNTNDGAIVEKKFGLGILPLIRFPEGVQKDYRIAFFDKGYHLAELTCFDHRNKVDDIQHIIRKEADRSLSLCSSESYIIKENFDRIQIRVEGIGEGYILPIFKEAPGNTQYTFAVDFGTTNTHIEYCTDQNPNPIAFNISPKEKQLTQLHSDYGADHDIRLGFLHDFIPDTIGENNDVYAFPMRTVYAFRKGFEETQQPRPLADGNIPFLYEKEATLQYNDIRTNLKWGDSRNDKERQRMESLLNLDIETLFILMRNKVVLNGGFLSGTKIVWFYPASMTLGKINQFKKIWNDAYIKYFGTDTKNVISISESTAPYSYYSKKRGARSEVVTIDVGGGTTDVFVVERNVPQMLLSFRFASNAIFGDGYNYDSDQNGFVTLYKNMYVEMLNSNKLLPLTQALNQIESQKRSSDIVAFLFSLVGDKVGNNKAFNFLEKLEANDRLRYVFIIFYGAILYFIAKSMKAQGLKKPLTLAFSGNGAHSLKIVSNDPETVGKFAQLIFDGVYNDGTHTKIQVIMEENPKKATCKGGILSPDSQDYDSIRSIKTIFLGDEFEKPTDKDLTYSQITHEMEAGVLNSVTDFFTFLFDLHKNNDDFFCEYLSADPTIFDQVKELCMDKTQLQQSLQQGLDLKRKEVTDATRIEETMFFYPLITILHDLAMKIGQMK